MDIQFFLILFFLIISLHFSPASASTMKLNGGTSLSVENPEDVLTSPSGVFSAGFYPVGDNAHCFAIWFSKPSCNNNCTVVWMANRNFPVNGKSSELLLLMTGNLILTDAGKSLAWTTDTTSLSPVELRLHDNGNLVLKNTESVVVWQSFDSPSDTLLPLQPFTRYTQLVSSKSATNSSTGFYKLIFDNDNLIRLLYDGPETSSSYWPYPWLRPWEGGRFPYNNSRIARFDLFGIFCSSDNLNFVSLDSGERLQRRLTLDSDGNLRLYSRREDNPTWFVSWQAKSQLCEIHGICGQGSTCSYDPISGPKCTCLPGHRIKKTGDWSYGCEPEFNLVCRNKTDVGFIKLKDVEFYGNDEGFHENITSEMCEQICLESCSCKGFQHRFIGENPYPNCYPKMSLMNGQYTPSMGGSDFYVKVSKTILFSGNDTFSETRNTCSTQQLVILDRSYPKSRENGTFKGIFWLAGAFGGVEIFGALLVWCFLKYSQNCNEATQSYNLAATGFKRFTYSELKKASRNFCEEIGRGAGGIVYKGTLADNRIAAIKRLIVANQGEDEFLAEVSTLGKLNHMNLIEIWGYCAEGNHRLLVYEYVVHGSLMDNLSLKTLDWQKRFEIALGTAKGLAYLHEECLEWVLHCDIKPQNILLDSNYQPKVSDFGLSKQLSRDELRNSSFSKIRGTRGYMAPEWVYNLPITSKVDVYSYGIVVLEMMSGKSVATASCEDIEYRRLVKLLRDKRNGADGKPYSWMEETIDPILDGKYDKSKMEILLKVALQCVEDERDARPTMSKVVEMLLPLDHINDH